MRSLTTLVVLAGAAAVASCTARPRAGTLAGAPAPARFPRVDLPRAPQQIVFKWRYSETEGFGSKGEGVARTAYPDSARLDFFLDGGFGRGWAILLGDQLIIPGPDFVRRFIPPAPMLWAAVGRLSLPPAGDTTARASGDTLRADVGTDPVWRVTFVKDRLARVEHIEGGRIVEWFTRSPEGAVRYVNEGGRRSLELDITRVQEVPGHDAAIWRR
jgi:hypothetical protein